MRNIFFSVHARVVPTCLHILTTLTAKRRQIKRRLHVSRRLLACLLFAIVPCFYAVNAEALELRINGTINNSSSKSIDVLPVVTLAEGSWMNCGMTGQNNQRFTVPPHTTVVVKAVGRASHAGAVPYAQCAYTFRVHGKDTVTLGKVASKNYEYDDDWVDGGNATVACYATNKIFSTDLHTSTEDIYANEGVSITDARMQSCDTPDNNFVIGYQVIISEKQLPPNYVQQNIREVLY